MVYGLGFVFVLFWALVVWGTKERELSGHEAEVLVVLWVVTAVADCAFQWRMLGLGAVSVLLDVCMLIKFGAANVRVR